MKASVLIPAKGFTNAKQRLSSLLDSEERASLAEAMLRDVLDQVVSARGLEASFVVTPDARVAEIASSAGAEAVREEEERGETEAVVLGLATMKQRGIEAVLVIPADIPLVHSTDIECLLEPLSQRSLTPPCAVLVPSHDRLGTNGLLLSPPHVISPRFGYDSFAYHLTEVAAKGASLRILDNERIALDIDEPRDLERLVEIVGRASTELSRTSGSCPPLNFPQGRELVERLNEEDNRARGPIHAGKTYARLLRMGVAARLLQDQQPERLWGGSRS